MLCPEGPYKYNKNIENEISVRRQLALFYSVCRVQCAHIGGNAPSGGRA